MTSPKLTALREWLTIHETASELRRTLGEPVSEADVLRLALDGHLSLAVYVPVALSVECQPAETDELDPDTERRSISGLWNLPLLGPARVEVERRHQSLLGNYVPVPRPRGAFVEDGQWICRLPPDEGASGMTPRSPSELSEGSVLCVRRTAIQEFLANAAPQLAADKSKDPESLGRKERDSLLVIIAALMEEARISRAQTSKAAINIEAMTERQGARVARRTIENHLKRIDEALERRSRDHD